MIDPRLRGVFFGIANAVVLAALYALLSLADDQRHCGAELGCPWFVQRDPQFGPMFLAVLMHAMPIGILGGALLGFLAAQLAGQRFAALVLSLVAVSIAGALTILLWRELAPLACLTVVANACTLSFSVKPTAAAPSHP